VVIAYSEELALVYGKVYLVQLRFFASLRMTNSAVGEETLVRKMQ